MTRLTIRLFGECIDMNGNLDVRQKRKILVVDDDTSVFDYLQAGLGRFYELQFLSRPKQIIPYVTRYWPDLILCDIDMPDMSGGDVCNVLEHSGVLSRIPFVYLTSYVSPEEVILLEGNIGGRDGISKSTPMHEMLERIESLMLPD